MAELADKYKDKHKAFTGSSLLFTLASIIAIRILHRYFELPYMLVLPLAGGIAWFVDYWIPPKPPVSLAVWIVRISGITSIMVVSFWIVPTILSQILWTPVAYALPIFVVLFSKFWVPSVYAEKFWVIATPVVKDTEVASKRRKNLLNWASVSLVIATLVGVVAYYIPDK
jgi:hypothetical protein